MHAYVFPGKAIFSDEPSAFYRNTSLFCLSSCDDLSSRFLLDWRFYGDLSFAADLSSLSFASFSSSDGDDDCDGAIFGLSVSEIVLYASTLS